MASVPPSAKLHLFAGNAPKTTADRLDRHHAMLARLARLERGVYVQCQGKVGAGKFFEQAVVEHGFGVGAGALPSLSAL